MPEDPGKTLVAAAGHCWDTCALPSNWYKLPEDPEKRLEWVQFLLEINRQRLKESSWTDITICAEHFTEDSFESPSPTGTLRLKASAVPSLCVRTEADEPSGSPTQRAVVLTDGYPCSKTLSEIVTFGDEERDPSDEGEEGDEGEMSSDSEWNPTVDVVLAKELTKDLEDGTDNEGEEEKDCVSPSGLRINELCTECGSFFNIQKPHMCEHKVKPYSCNICGERCVTEMALKNHSFIHDETYDHPCKFCHVTFKNKLDKLKHEQGHQERKDPYKCPDCPKTFPTNRERRVHLTYHRTATEFKCGVCGIAFKDVHHLRRHSVVHTGLKPYKCPVCQRGFNQGSHLKSHMRLHTGERPYKCHDCDKSFNHNVSLKSHVQRYHSARSGRKRKVDEGPSDSGDAEDTGSKKGTDSESENVEQQDTEEEVQKGRVRLPKSRRRSTGRPKGRPKGKTAANLALPGQKGEQCSNTKATKSKKKTGFSDEEREAEQSDSEVPFDSVEEEEEMAKKSRGRPVRPQKNPGHTDFVSKEKIKRKRNSCQNSVKSAGGRRARPKKNVAV